MGWLPSDEAVSLVPVSWRGWKHERHPSIRSARRGVPHLRGGLVFIIGIDPHKGSQTAAVIDRDERVVDEATVQARKGIDSRFRRRTNEAPRTPSTSDGRHTSSTR